MMARLSHTVMVRPPSAIFSTGTLPAGEWGRMVSRVVGLWLTRSLISTVSKGWRMARSAT